MKIASSDFYNNLFFEWISGGLANALTSALLNPLDVTKTKLQISKAKSTVSKTMLNIVRSEGFLGLWLPGVKARCCIFITAS